jgi:hypothetical protein
MSVVVELCDEKVGKYGFVFSLPLVLPKKSLAMSSGPLSASRGVWGGGVGCGGVGLVRERACVEASGG